MVFIIAELGTNHMGDIQNAKKLINAAAFAGCDAVKLQKKNVEKIYTKEFLDSPIDSPWGSTQRNMRQHREFNDNQFKQIDLHCKRKKIPWYVSCWDVESQIHMRKFRTKFNKIASAMLVHEKLLEIVAKEKKYTFISTGMSTLSEISRAVSIFKKYKCNFELMHSHSAYPMPAEEANLKVINTLQKKFNCKVGYSGHETGSYLLCVTAVLLGASSIERHITLDRSMYGSDQAASLEPKGLERMVRDIRSLSHILGDGKKIIWDSELPAKKKLREIFV